MPYWHGKPSRDAHSIPSTTRVEDSARRYHSVPMSELVNLDGLIVKPEDAKISVYDRSFLFGDSVYETLRTYGGRLFAVDEHMARLQASAERLMMRFLIKPDEIVRRCIKTMVAAGNDESYVRIVLSRGIGEFGLEAGLDAPGHLVIIVRPFIPPSEVLYRHGVDVVVANVRRNPRQALDPAIKSGNYLNSVLAAIEAKEAGAYDAVFLTLDGFVAEATTSAIFLVKEDALYTPPLETGILDSITRRLVLRSARSVGIQTHESPIPEQILYDADELFLASTTKEILPITSIHGKPVGKGVPGPHTATLTEALRLEIETMCAKNKNRR
jgi:branched-chain amino acid aminotransferase